MTRFIILITGITVTIISLNFFPCPFIWIFFSWFFVFLGLAKTSKKHSFKLLLFYISLIPFTVGIFETYLFINTKIHSKYTEGVIIRNHNVLGYAPLAGSKASHAKYFNNDLIFDVEYKINSDGLRISPPYNSRELLGSILFFGGSFTYGTGLNDIETMPYQTGIKTHGKYYIYNFGFRGYGPHQMLAAIEFGIVEKIVKFRPKYAIYQALIGHIGRAAGLAFWDTYGPKYVLNKDGKIVYEGNYNKWIIAGLRESFIFTKIMRKKLGRINSSSKYVNLFIEIIDKSRKMLETRYPGCEFHVLLRGSKDQTNYTEVLEKLKQKGIKIHPINDIFNYSNISFKGSELIISEHDPHPSPLANEIIARYLTEKIIKME